MRFPVRIKPSIPTTMVATTARNTASAARIGISICSSDDSIRPINPSRFAKRSVAPTAEFMKPSSNADSSARGPAGMSSASYPWIRFETGGSPPKNDNNRSDKAENCGGRQHRNNDGAARTVQRQRNRPVCHRVPTALPTKLSLRNSSGASWIPKSWSRSPNFGRMPVDFNVPRNFPSSATPIPKSNR